VKVLLRLIGLNSKDDLPVSPSKRLYREGAAHVTAQEFDKALALFIKVIRNDRYYDDDGARKACVAIFKYLGEEHPVTQKYRREFSNALY
jgi:putative thioredoxin